MSRTIAATAIGLVLAVSVGVAQNVAFGKSPAPAVSASTPERVDNFRLVDAAGRSHELYRMKDAPAIVLVTHKSGASEIKKTAAQIEALKAAYAGKGVEFFLLNSNVGETREAALADAKAHGLSMPVLMDDHQFIGEQLGVERVGEVFVIEPKSWKIAYRGVVAEGKSPAKAHAAKALDAVLAGKPAPVAVTQVKGTKIAFPNRTPQARAAHQEISYADTIAPILEAKCVACHQEGGIAPFAMDSYQKVKGFAPMIREAVRTDRMPPWDADPHVGKFKDDKSLTRQEAQTLVHWVEAGAPRGEGPDPLAATKHVAPDWPLGTPDMIIDIPAYTVPATGVVDYQYPTIPNPLTEGKWLKASTAKVSARQAVHHILSGHIPEGQKGTGMADWGGSVGGYTVGMESIVNPKGIGSFIPAGGKIGYQMHYTPFGKEVVSAEKIGLYFYKDGEKPELIMREQPLVDQFITIPPNDGNHKEVAYFNFPKDAILHTAVVHAHYRGTYSNLKIRYPDGKEKMLINVPFYDFNWQRMYEFEQPVEVPAGSKLIATYIYDNSKRNPANPDPSQTITWGDQSFEEMFYTSLRYRWNDETVAAPTNYDELLLKTRVLGMMDDNVDDKLQKSELRGPFAQMAAAPGAFEMADGDKDGGIDQAEFDRVMAMMQQMRRNQQAPKPAAQADGAKPASGR
jgi:peroxiredoxin